MCQLIARRKTKKIFNLNILPLVNQNLTDVTSFNKQLNYAEKLYQATFQNISKVNNTYPSIVKNPKPDQAVTILNTVTMPFSVSDSRKMTDFYVKQWILYLVSNGSIPLIRTPSGASSETIIHKLAIHTNVNVIDPINRTTCVDICGYFSSVNVIDIPGIRNQPILYKVIPFQTPSCSACATDYLSKSALNDLVSFWC
jgi:hypothetical protein